MNKTKKQWAMFLLGLTAILIGVSILGFFGLRKCYRLYQRQVLLENNPVVEIADLNIKAPILEGTDNETLAKAAGHFKDSGDFGKGCWAQQHTVQRIFQQSEKCGDRHGNHVV